IEALASTIQDTNMFINTQAAGDLRSGYYETHIVFSLTEPYLTDPIHPFSEDSRLVITSELKQLSRYNDTLYEHKLYWVPLSFNLKKAELAQCFLTLRHYSDNFDNVRSDEQKVFSDIQKQIPTLSLVKVIREFVCMDDNPYVDAEIKFNNK